MMRRPIPLPFALDGETFSVIPYRQQQIIMIESEIDLHLASRTVLDSVTHCFLSDPVKLT